MQIRYFVGGSRLPHIYNLGGDLGFFIECIRAGNQDALRSYAYDCVDVGYHMSVGFNVPVITIGLVQGDALGGGFEGALSFNVLVAERSAKFGLPEILFNLFPGMGAFSFLSRKLNSAHAQRMIMSGKIYSAEELHALGLVDVLADDGHGEEAVRDYIARNTRAHVAHRSIYRARRRSIRCHCRSCGYRRHLGRDRDASRPGRPAQDGTADVDAGAPPGGKRRGARKRHVGRPARPPRRRPAAPARERSPPTPCSMGDSNGLAAPVDRHLCDCLGLGSQCMGRERSLDARQFGCERAHVAITLLRELAIVDVAPGQAHLIDAARPDIAGRASQGVNAIAKRRSIPRRHGGGQIGDQAVGIARKLGDELVENAPPPSDIRSSSTR